MIKVILWDIDGTLLNFKEAEKYAICKCFSIFNLGECSDEMISRYSEINDKYWKSLERGEITKKEVLHNRFAEFFEKEQIDFEEIDAFNENYQIRLGDTIYFNDDCYDLVKKLKGRVKQYAVTNGTYVAQERKLKRSGLDGIFDDVFISEKLGLDKPNKAFFDAVWEKIGEYKKDEILIVGDSLTSDMLGGVNAGIRCCWYNPYKMENNSNLDLEFEIQNLWEVEKIMKSEEMMRETALKEGFTSAVFMDVKDLSFEPELRKYCEENLCGNYDKNYACPPYCGTPKEMEEKAKQYSRALVLQSIRQVTSVMNHAETKEVQKEHNQRMLYFIKQMKEQEIEGLAIMAGPCALCETCGKAEQKPCRFPENLASCLSAYCINAQKMTEHCKIPYRCGENQVSFFSIYLI